MMNSWLQGKINLRNEWCRFATYKLWDGMTSAIHLSSNGIYYTGTSLDVKCYKCLKVTSLVGIEDFIIDRKKLHNLECQWISEWDSENEPIHGINLEDEQKMNDRMSNHIGDSMNKIDIAMGALACCPYENCDTHTKNENYTRKLPLQKKGGITRTGYVHILRQIQLSEAERPSYASVRARGESFLNTIPTTRHSLPVDKIIEAGFYMKGTSNVVYCFHCGLGLRTDTEDFDPWIDHARFVPTCPYVLSKKGSTFIHSCLETTVTEIVTEQQQYGHLMSAPNTAKLHEK